MREQAAAAPDVGKGSKHSAADSIGFITAKLSRPPHNPPSLQLPGTYTEPTKQTGELEERITSVKVTPPPQDTNIGLPVASIHHSEKVGFGKLVPANVVIGSDEHSNFLLSGQSIFSNSKCPPVLMSNVGSWCG